jgi:hypothetical protein
VRAAGDGVGAAALVVVGREGAAGEATDLGVAAVGCSLSRAALLCRWVTVIDNS